MEHSNEKLGPGQVPAVHVTYDWGRSHFTAPAYPATRAVESRPFVRVVNEGTKEYNELGIAKDVESVDLHEAAKAVVRECPDVDKARGNMQLNVLFNGGENHVRNPFEHYGCSVPIENKGSSKWHHVAVKLSHVARKMNIPWVDGALMDAERRSLFSSAIHIDNVFEGLTIAVLELYPRPGKVREHTDHFNCLKLTDTLLLSQIVNLDGVIYRVCAIAYMRKSCHDTLVRRSACKETVEGTMDHLQSLDKALLPKVRPAEHKDYYQSLGKHGVGVILEKPREGELLQLKALALMSPAHMDKPMSYLSVVADAIRRVHGNNQWMTHEDLVLMALPVGQLNGLFTYGSVLMELSEEQLEVSNGPLGILGLIVNRMCSLAGSYSAGKFTRAQVSWQRQHMDVERTTKDIQLILDRCSNTSEVAPCGMDYETYCRQQCYEHVCFLKKHVYGIGDFGAQHLVTVLAQLQLMRPVGMIHGACFAVSTTTLKNTKVDSTTKNPCMLAYLNNGKSLDNPGNKRDRARRVLESVVPYMRVKERMPWLTDTVVEQINCERLRQPKQVVDLFFPGSSNLFLTPFHSAQPCALWKMDPNMTDGEVDVRATLAAAPEPRKKTMQCCQQQICGTLSTVARSGSQPMTYCRVPFEYINEFPGLMDEVREQFLARSVNGGMNGIKQWAVEHPLFSHLIHYFVAHPLPLNGKSNANRIHKSPKELAEVILSQLAGRTGNSVPLLASETKRDQIVDKEALATSSEKSDVQELRTTRKGFSGADIVPAGVLSHCQSGRSNVLLTNANGLRLYRFPNQKALMETAIVELNGWKSLSKIASSVKYRMSLAPVTVEAKHSFTFGLQDVAWASTFNKRHLQLLVCDNTTHKLPGRTRSNGFFVCKWKQFDSIPFFVCDHCALTDAVAMGLGAIKAEVKDMPGRSNWVFPTPALTRRHFFQCIMLLGGKPAYFQRLFNRIKSNAKRNGWILKDDPHTVVALDAVDSPMIGSPTLFYALLRNDNDKRGLEWLLVPAGQKGAKKTTVHALTLDVSSWKNCSEMVPDCVQNPISMATRRSRKRARAAERKMLASFEDEHAESSRIQKATSPTSLFSGTCSSTKRARAADKKKRVAFEDESDLAAFAEL